MSLYPPPPYLLQACQSFLPSRIGRPAQRPEALGRRLLLTGAVVGVTNSALAAAILLFGAGLFVSDAAVIRQVAALVPFVAAGLFVHTSSMATEGIMLAGRRYYYLVGTYVANCGLVYLTYSAVIAAGLGPLLACWYGVLTFQGTRLLTNLAVLASPMSVLRSDQPLQALKTT